MNEFVNFIQVHKPYFDAAQAVSAVLSLILLLTGFVLVISAWRSGRISNVSVGPLVFQMKEQAVEAVAGAVRGWKAHAPEQKLDIARIRRTVGRAFQPENADILSGKAILWVDDNPGNNRLAVRAFRKLMIDVEQVLSTDAALAAMETRRFDLIISDMGRGKNMLAGYELLDSIRKEGNKVPFLIFAGSDTPQFRKEAAERDAQLSTNDMLELVEVSLTYLEQ